VFHFHKVQNSLMGTEVICSTAQKSPVSPGHELTLLLLGHSLDAKQEEVSTAVGLQSIVEAQSHVAAQLETSHTGNLSELQQITHQNFSVDYKVRDGFYPQTWILSKEVSFCLSYSPARSNVTYLTHFCRAGR
jgi:hypothetical protein